MSTPSIGKPLFREEVDLRLYVAYGYPVVFIAFGVFLVGLSRSFAPLLPIALVVVAAGAALVVAMILLIPARSAVQERGVSLSVRPWSRILGAARRHVPAEEIVHVWPVIFVRPIDDERVLEGYEVVHREGRGRVLVGSGGDPKEAGPKLTAAVRAMLGPHWETVYRPIRPLGQDLIDRIREAVSRPKRLLDWRFAVGIFLAVGATFTAQFVSLLARGGGIGFAWLLLAIAGASVAVVLGLVLMGTGWRASSRRREAISVYLQARDFERESGTRILPDLEIHPDYAKTAPAAVVDTELGTLLKDFRKERWAYVYMAGMVVLAIGALLIVFALRLSVWIILAAMLASFAFLAPMMWTLTASVAAGARIDAIIREEWKTGTRLLPPEFKAPRRFPRFETPPRPTEPQLRRMRVAIRYGSQKWALLFGLAPFVPLVVLLALGFRGTWPVGIFIASFVLYMVAILWISAGRSLLRRLRDYEEASGREVLPPALSLRRTR